MSKTLKTVLACVIALLPFAANALGLGEIKLNSGLNQPLDAVIPIVGATPDEIGSLHIKVASTAQFKQAGIPMSDVLRQLQFKIVTNADGTASVHVTTVKPMNDPFVDFLADATWDNGELIREYTVFLNPPNFESASPATPAPAAASIKPAAAAPAAPVGTTAAPPPAAKPAPAAAATPTAPAPAPAPQVTAPSSAAPTVTAASSQLGSNYGPIHRGETLSQIAWSMRPQGVTLNQMMIAIYRANPEVFMHNINLMKAGYVLRIPTLTDIQAVKVSEANAEVRTQIASWRAGREHAAPHKPVTSTGEQPSLQLVAPTSAASANENQLPGAGKGKTGATTAAAGAANKAGTGTAAGPAATTSNAPIAVKNSSMAAVQAQANKQNEQATEAKTTPLKPEKPAVVKPLPKNKIKPVPVQTNAQSGGLLDSLFNPYVIVAVIVIILLLIAGIFIKKRRAAAEIPVRPVKIKKAPTADVDWEKQEKAGLKDVTNRASDEAQAAKPAADTAASATAAHMTTTNLKLDESDPMTEADFHMAYGLYDQAADVLNKALQQDPSRRDLKLKLLEVYFTAGDRTNFVDTARSLRQEMGDKPDKDWENVAIMGRQVAPEEALFSAEGAPTAGASVDIPLESGGTGTAVATDLDPLAGAFEGVRPVSMPTDTTKTRAEEQHVVDFSLPDIEPTPKSKKAAPAAPAAAPAAADKKPAPAPAKKGAEHTVTADFGTDSQVEFDKALKELSDFVNTNVPPQEEGGRSGTGTGTVAGQSMSLAADAEAPAAQAGTTTGTGEETTGLNEIGTKLDLARAYIDMGDADGAKNILQEVLEEGDSQQQQEAKQLLQNLT